MTDEKHEDEKHDKPEPVKTSDSDKPELAKHDEKPTEATSNVVTKDEKSTPAKSYTSWALIGVAVGAAAYAVLHFVLHAF